MKKQLFIFKCFIIMTFLISSCATLRVNYSGKKVEKPQNITLISTMLGKIQQPLFPLIDAAAFNDKTNSIADQIMDLQKKNIDKFREIIASSLKRNFNCNILYSDSLLKKSGFEELKSNYDFKSSLRIENDHFPFIITATGDINPFRFEKGDVYAYFKNPANFKSVVSTICKKTNADIVVVSYSTLTVTGAGMFGIYGYLRLDTNLYIFDKEGDLISDGHNCSKQTNIGGKEIEQYKGQLDNISLIIEPVVSTVAKNLQPK
jgi:hypothetical protein